ncbi:MAG: GNAT family N-acetyltransferase [Holophagales bacterium]|nr:GNAT family N-acetyltransferase [Holophagales bacterium]
MPRVRRERHAPPAVARHGRRSEPPRPPARLFPRRGLPASDWHAQRFRARLAAASPADAGWFGWYGITRTAPFASPTLVVAAGFVGPPGEDGTVETGYSVVPEARGLGYATEAVKALLAWALRNGASRVIAHTTPANAASVTVLLRCGFVEDGPGEEPGTVRFATRASAG